MTWQLDPLAIQQEESHSLIETNGTSPSGAKVCMQALELQRYCKRPGWEPKGPQVLLARKEGFFLNLGLESFQINFNKRACNFRKEMRRNEVGNSSSDIDEFGKQ